MRRLLSMGQREDRALAFVMAGCTVVFMSQWPILARQAHLEKQDLNMLLGAALLAWIILAPLLLYCLSGLTYIGGIVLGRKGSAFAARLALFWSLLASSPLMLLNGLEANKDQNNASLAAKALPFLPNNNPPMWVRPDRQ